MGNVKRPCPLAVSMLWCYINCPIIIDIIIIIIIIIIIMIFYIIIFVP